MIRVYNNLNQTIMKSIFEKDLSGEMVSPNEPGYNALIEDIFATIKVATEMNTGYRTPEEVHGYMDKILGKPLEESTTVLPPLYIDYGKPITIGKGCFIQQCCTFFGRGGITIGDEVFIGPKVNLITINHDPDPENRSATYGRPITIEDKVWMRNQFDRPSRSTYWLRRNYRGGQCSDQRRSSYDCGSRESSQIYQENQ